MDIDILIEKKITELIFEVRNKTKWEKSLIHYNSVLNLSRRIVLYKDPKAISLKQNLVEYFILLNQKNYKIDNKYESSILHNKFILPLEKYLIKNDQFVTNSDIHLFMVLGLVIDVCLSFFLSNYYYPLFIFSLFVIGYFRKKRAQRNNKYSHIFW